jgi:hypothetical protein
MILKATVILIDTDNAEHCRSAFQNLESFYYEALKLSTEPYHRPVNIQTMFIFCLHISYLFGSQHIITAFL